MPANLGHARRSRIYWRLWNKASWLIGPMAVPVSFSASKSKSGLMLSFVHAALVARLGWFAEMFWLSYS